MADNVWKLLLEAEDRILEKIKEDTDALGKLAAEATKIPPLKLQSNVREVVAKDAAALDTLKAKASSGIEVTVRNGGRATVAEAALAGLYRQRLGGGPDGGGPTNPWDRVLNKALPGGGLGNALGGAFGGGMATTIGIGAVFAAIAGAGAIISSAQQTNAASQRQMKVTADLLAVSNGANEAMSLLGNSMATLGLIAKKLAGEVFGQVTIAFQALAGALALVLSGKGAWKRMEATGGDLLATAYGEQFLGGTGAPEAAAAQDRLEKKLADKKARDLANRSAAGANGPEVLSGVPIDDMARRGLFVGSSSGTTLQQLQADANRKLDRIAERLGTLPAGIAQSI